MDDDPAPDAAPIVAAPPDDAPGVDEPVVGAIVEPVPEPAPAPGCMADEPVVAEPEPVAVGRSVEPDGVVEVWASAGAAAKAVATRQAAMCFFSIFIS
jgi:hypothetical protein